MSVTVEAVQEALKGLLDPNTKIDFVTAKNLKNLRIEDGDVSFDIVLGYPAKSQFDLIRKSVINAVRALPGVKNVSVNVSSQVVAHAVQRGVKLLPGVKNIIAVASGKGGVGKSTTAVNLALAMVAQGKRVGLLDADIYGPSIPRMLGLSGKPEIVNDKMQPLIRYGIRTNSMGYITGDEAAILRAPMITKALNQLLRLTNWGTEAEPLDVLLIDMPPGTGDIHLSVVQQVQITGAIIVTTPQEVATIDARKCADMFQKTGVKLLGVVENMSYFTDTTGNKIPIFGEGGGKKLADEFNMPLLGSVPIDIDLRSASDNGLEYKGFCAEIYRKIAQELKL